MNATAPRVTLADIEARIVHEGYVLAGHADWRPGPGWSEEDNEAGSPETLTLCILVLRNGFTVTGESACANPEEFDAEKGRQYARENAVEKAWPLLVYELKCRLHERAQCLAEPQLD